MQKLVLVSLLFLVGCSKGIVPVSGKLIKGPDPIANVMITLVPEPNAGREFAVGGTDDNGIFIMYTLPSKGVSPGDYKIKLQPPIEGKAVSQIPGKFVDISTTPWFITIPSNGIENLVLDVDQDKLK
ncbi:MAG: hypothetical protein JHD26_12850 [Gemmataceae bacterium]|jgi:hypothetical protein|nr:hypothetical protein [Gemmataceae bacterium]MBJ7496663.1 hypothetical protein [Gemmataceae bacterium]